MGEEAVCNASPLIFLAKIGKIELLNRYTLHIPAQVESEIKSGLRHGKEDARQIIEYLKIREIGSVKVTPLRDLPHFLGPGERAVISLAVKENIKKVFMDESKARTVARFKGLKPKGTLGILWEAYKTGAISKEGVEMLTIALVQKGYRIKEELLVEFLKRLKF